VFGIPGDFVVGTRWWSDQRDDERAAVGVVHATRWFFHGLAWWVVRYSVRAELK
jgi:hypothetical protein